MAMRQKRGKPARANNRPQRAKKVITEELFALISNHVQDIIAITSPDGRVEYISPAVHKLLGYLPDEIIGTLTDQTFHPEDWTAVSNSGLFRDSDEDVFKCRVKHKNGHYVWFETTVKLIRDDNGTLRKVIGVGRDISDRMKAEEEVRQTKEHLESLIRNSADAIWMSDTEDVVLEVNPAFETMFGWTAEEVVGRKLPIIPKVLRDSMDQLHRRVKSGSSVAGFETIRLRKDGSYMDVEATLSPVRDHDGHVVGMTGICRDITLRRRTEAELQEKTKLLESFIEHNEDAIILSNNEGQVQRVNRTFERMFGWSQEEVLGLDFYSLPIIPDDYLEDAYRWGEQVNNGQSIIGAETVRKHRNGDLLNVALTASPIRDGKGTKGGWAITIRDITAWKAAQEHLQNAEKLSAAGQLAAGIAHEIRNPMTTIKGFITLLKPLLEEKKQYVDIINSEIERIELILNELLILAKPQLGKCETKDVRELISQVAALLDSLAILHNVQFVTEFHESASGAQICCDENQLKQVFINFIKNAIEAMPDGGTITIQTRCKNDREVVIRIQDEGCGIPQDILAKIGQPFYTTKEKGTGLGFMISKKIIEYHSGGLYLESEWNKGTAIEITLPCADA